MSLRQFIEALEDSGEVITIAYHSRENGSITCKEKIVFALDELPAASKKRKVNKARCRT